MHDATIIQVHDSFIANERSTADVIDGRRISAHGGNVAKTAYDAASTDNFWREPVAAKVNSFKREVGGDEEIESVSNLLDGAVISDAGN